MFKKQTSKVGVSLQVTLSFDVSIAYKLHTNW